MNISGLGHRWHFLMSQTNKAENSVFFFFLQKICEIHSGFQRFLGKEILEQNKKGHQNRDINGSLSQNLMKWKILNVAQKERYVSNWMICSYRNQGLTREVIFPSCSHSDSSSSASKALIGAITAVDSHLTMTWKKVHFQFFATLFKGWFVTKRNSHGFSKLASKVKSFNPHWASTSSPSVAARPGCCRNVN